NTSQNVNECATTPFITLPKETTLSAPRRQLNTCATIQTRRWKIFSAISLPHRIDLQESLLSLNGYVDRSQILAGTLLLRDKVANNLMKGCEVFVGMGVK